MKKSLGICLGASSVSYTVIEQNDGDIKIIAHNHKLHNGKSYDLIKDIIKEYSEYHIVLTGRKARKNYNLTHISEPEATEIAYNQFYKNTEYNSIASVGGETFVVYKLDEFGKIYDLVTKNQCASGTGEFFLQQIKRMNLDLNQASEIALNSKPHKVSGRCSVFCKSDCTHALNIGIPKAEVTSGLALMIADKIEELTNHNHFGRTLLVGGVTLNNTVMEHLNNKSNKYQVSDYALHFESLGAALYGLKNKTLKTDISKLLKDKQSSFTYHKPLNQFKDLVEFKTTENRKNTENEDCIVGIDVGSTTTKAVIISINDNKILASEYLYTHGNPIEAAKKCYLSLSDQIDNSINIIGLGVTGSGREITGLHALTDGVINEIIAHANAAVFYDKDVDTIFEIGGQDAKYTYIINKVPADYAMNEACSAGTGSFIEEAAYESLGLKVTEIQDIAMKSDNPPNFSDQCAAFISSDIKTALQENISIENIVGGLVYSIALNYVNRVKGNRNIGNKIFMQGGVCYNKAIPIAMAALTGKKIIVPPDPGLTGAFGVALGVKEKIELGIIKPKHFDLIELANRTVQYHKPFICNGGKEQCDRQCSINVIEVNGKRFPFGGACNKYYNLKNSTKFDYEEYDLVKYRNKLMFVDYAPEYNLNENAKTIGINKSLNTHTLFPFYYNFFSSLGLRVVLSDKPIEEALEREHTAFCYPAQISIMMFQDLLNKNTDYIFLPKIFELQAENHEQRLDFNCTCVFVSGENLFLRQAYRDYKINNKLIDPTLNLSNGIKSEKEKFIKIGEQLGIYDEEKINSAFENAINYQQNFQKALINKGKEVISEIEKESDAFGIVLLGRPYNSFTENANKGIPRKFATKGVRIIPYDMLDFIDENVEDNMYWESGKKILKSTKIIKNHPKLFVAYISNFSCAPDSMILSTFRDIMGSKPSLTLELDGHTADAGINTRIEAALDIINNYRKMDKSVSIINDDFTPAYLDFGKDESFFVDSEGNRIPMNSEEVEILIPSMGDLAAELFAAAFRSLGYSAKALPESNPNVLKYGRSVASGKECLPLILLSGLLLDYIENQWDGKKKIAYFVVQGAGNCRLGQYPVFLRNMIKKKKLKNTALMVLMNEDGFAGFGSKFAMRGIQAIIASDVLDDVRSAILANAKEPEIGLAVFNNEFKKLALSMEKTPDNFYKSLEFFSNTIKENIPAGINIEDSNYIALLGEIYVRRDGFAHKWLNKIFAKEGFIVKDAYISEWILYVDYLLKIDLLEPDKSFRKKLERQIRTYFTRMAEKNIKKNLAKSGYYRYSKTEIKPLLESSKHLVPLEFKGEPGLTTGTALYEGLDKYCGVINVGPFGCMPTRITEAIASPSMYVKDKVEAIKQIDPKYKISSVFNGNMKIPFLTIETDGNVYPQVIESRIETFALQCKRTAELMKLSKNGINKNGINKKGK